MKIKIEKLTTLVLTDEELDLLRKALVNCIAPDEVTLDNADSDTAEQWIDAITRAEVRAGTYT